MVVGWQYANKQRPPQLKHRSNLSRASILFKPIFCMCMTCSYLSRVSFLLIAVQVCFLKQNLVRALQLVLCFVVRGVHTPVRRPRFSVGLWCFGIIAVICDSILTACTVARSHRNPRSVDLASREITTALTFPCEKQQSSRRVSIICACPRAQPLVQLR